MTSTTKMERREFLINASLLAGGAAVSATLPCAAVYGAGTDPTELGAVTAVEAMRNGDIKAEDYARALLDRAQQLESLNAFRVLNREMVLEAARAADKARSAGAKLGLLHGLPIPVKDSVDTKALPTSNGTRALRDFMAKDDAAVLKPLFAQGAILMGKTNLHELSYGWTSNNGVFGPVRNPYDRDRIPGGSSGGSGAAVAARMAPLAIAEDTLGSIRVPATMCGLAGLRPSYGRYPDDGIMPLSTAGFDQVGPVARSVADLALFDAVLTGAAPELPATSLSVARIGISPEYFFTGLDPEVERVNDEALRKLMAAGATLVTAEIPEAAKGAMDIAITIITFETVASISGFLEQQGTGLSFDQMLKQASEGLQNTMKAFALPPKAPTREAYEAALGKRQKLREAVRAYFETERIAALAFPPVLIPPPKIGVEAEVEIRGRKVPFYVAMSRNLALGSCASMACLILPAGSTLNGLPVGIEFEALPGKDRDLLALGLSLEKALSPAPGPRI
jgi:indoleacetamide hydrolase